MKGVVGWLCGQGRKVLEADDSSSAYCAIKAHSLQGH
jgi:hypothetical protein